MRLRPRPAGTSLHVAHMQAHLSTWETEADRPRAKSKVLEGEYHDEDMRVERPSNIYIYAYIGLSHRLCLLSLDAPGPTCACGCIDANSGFNWRLSTDHPMLKAVQAWLANSAEHSALETPVDFRLGPAFWSDGVGSKMLYTNASPATPADPKLSHRHPTAACMCTWQMMGCCVGGVQMLYE